MKSLTRVVSFVSLCLFALLTMAVNLSHADEIVIRSAQYEAQRSSPVISNISHARRRYRYGYSHGYHYGNSHYRYRSHSYPFSSHRYGFHSSYSAYYRPYRLRSYYTSYYPYGGLYRPYSYYYGYYPSYTSPYFINSTYNYPYGTYTYQPYQLRYRVARPVTSYYQPYCYDSGIVTPDGCHCGPIVVCNPCDPIVSPPAYIQSAPTEAAPVPESSPETQPAPAPIPQKATPPNANPPQVKPSENAPEA